jgi:hypothetical protein
MYFDGTSIGMSIHFRIVCVIADHCNGIAIYVFSIAIYITSIIPTLRTIVTPLPGVDTRQDMIDAMQVLSASNVIIMACLGAILCLQVRTSSTALIRRKI